MKQGIKNAKASGGHWLGLALGVLCLLVQMPQAQAQRVNSRDTTGRRSAVLPGLLGDTVRVQLELQPDSLVAVPMGPVLIDSARLEWLRTPPTMRDLVGDRISCIETDAPHQFNNAVMSFVTLFTARNRSYLQRILERENLYFPLFEKYLTKYNLPTDLKYLAVVESSLIPTAKSPVGATGLWQFMGPTANDLRLQRDEWIDERMAPEKATEAACKHLRYLYGVFRDWELVLAAYNWGAGSVQRVMRRTGKKTFWDLYPHMPAETRNYVPTFTAIMYSMKYAEAHGLRTASLRYQYAEPMDTLNLRGYAFDLRRLSRACGYDDSLYLSRFNPELRRAALPAGYRPYVVRFPASAAANFGGADRNTLLQYCQPTAALPQPLLALPPRLEGVEPWINQTVLLATQGPRATAEAATPRFRRLAHRVKRGETLASLAERFEVSQAQLRRWNELPKGHPLKPGKELLVFVPQPVATPRRAPVAAPAPPVMAVAPRPAISEEEAQARREQAAANTREVARLQELARQEKIQEARLAGIRQRQAIQQAAAEVQARAAVRRVAQAQAAEVAEARRNELKAASAPALVSTPAASEAASATAMPETTPATYVVRKGDNLTRLAQKHGLSVAQLVDWNNLEAETVTPGQRLQLRAPAADEPAAEPARRQPKGTAVAKAAAPTRSAPAPKALAPQVHLVQRGDTLFNISRRFGVTVQVLRELNNLTSDEVKLGQKLLVPQG